MSVFVAVAVVAVALFGFRILRPESPRLRLASAVLSTGFALWLVIGADGLVLRALLLLLCFSNFRSARNDVHRITRSRVATPDRSVTVDVPLEDLRTPSGEPGGGLWGLKRPQPAPNAGSAQASPDSDVASVAEPVPAAPPSSRAHRK